MPERESPFESLEQFDVFDLEDMVQRRLAAYALRDFYGSSMSKIGQEYLEFPPDFRKRSPKFQWIKIKTRLEWVDGVDVPNNIDSHPIVVNKVSNDVDHDFDENPPIEPLQNARDKAQDWYEWLLDEAKRYRESVANMNSREMMLRMAREKIKSAKEDPSSRFSGLQNQQNDLNQEAEALQERLEVVEEKTERIPSELVLILTEALEIEQWENSLNDIEEDMARDAALSDKYDMYKGR
ncbi:hypothetical protein [Natronosalvus halobius]|uniref:hypothetical protein n=1 Tax=Natronosalvus halobius TaxID=2953746 RepID=UPI00209FA12F|nr:hypothetical protein [Natronosalvus halobius]USZ71264.1 hypothetical protein NGM15_14445 [Natronosalvus halobius]